jgi:hypothetical protein
MRLLLNFIAVGFLRRVVLFHGSKVIINFMRIEKGVRFIHGVGFSSSNSSWTHVSITAKALETTYDEGN